MERIADLRFANNLREPMTWAYETYGENIYTDLPKFEKKIIDWWVWAVLKTNCLILCILARLKS